jgi:N-acetylglucosamine-6-phosphate deacetylase
MRILGLSAYYHDSAACLVEDGVIVAAAQEERFTRRKHDAAFPLNAARYCLAEGGTPPEIDAVVFYDKPILKFHRLLETYFSVAPRGLSQFLQAMPLWLKDRLWVAPEIEGACEFIKYLRLLGIKPAIGHTDADHYTTERAILAGANHVTHFYNAMRPFTHRNPTAVSAILSRPECIIELIGDGIHVCPEVAAMTFNVLDSRRIALISDAVCPMGMQDGIHEVYGAQIELKDGRCSYENGSLFGGGLSLLSGLKTMFKKARVPLLRLGEAVSRTPAKVLGLQITDASVFLDREFNWLATRWRDEWFWREDQKA